MDGLGYAGGLLLAAVFAWAAIAKAIRPGRTARAFAGLGLPAPRVLAVAVPLAELGVAVALVVVPAAGASAALVALAFFSTLITARLARGDHAPCGCFGAASEAPLSAADLMRNLLLAGLAVGALLTGEPTTPSAEAVAAVALAGLQGVIIVAYVRGGRDRRARRRAPGTGADARVPTP